MCNANNHPPGCQCGWGGGWHTPAFSTTQRPFYPETYGGSQTAGPARPSRHSDPPTQRPRYTEKRGAFQVAELVRPSRCSECGDLVYFVRHNGGSVFLDELGPPWPKHGCNDASNVRYWAPSSDVAKLIAKFSTCPVCKVLLNAKNVDRHVRKVHRTTHVEPTEHLRTIKENERISPTVDIEAKREIPRPSRPNHPNESWTTCGKCGTHVKEANLQRHMRRKHGPAVHRPGRDSDNQRDEHYPGKPRVSAKARRGSFHDAAAQAFFAWYINQR